MAQANKRGRRFICRVTRTTVVNIPIPVDDTETAADAAVKAIAVADELIRRDMNIRNFPVDELACEAEDCEEEP